jgi:sec-independent protein translocase protein TatA
MLSGLENPVHLLFILVVALLVFGPKRLPSIGHSLGAGIREFRDSFSGEQETRSSNSPARQAGSTSDSDSQP